MSSRIETGLSIDTQMVTDRPSVLRDKRGRTVWNLPNNTLEQNEQLGIRNIQALFLERFPEFNELFPRREDGLIEAQLREQAGDFIVERIGSARKFRRMVGRVILNKNKIPYSGGSHILAITKSFESWGVNFRLVKPRGFWNDLINIENELNGVISSLGHFPNANELMQNREFSLISAITKTGGMNEWRRRLGCGVTRKDAGYSDSEENVEREIIRVMQTNGLNYFPSADQLWAFGESSISRGIQRTGGFRKWRERFGFTLRNKPNNYWTQETIELVFEQQIQKGKTITQADLIRNGRNDLNNAIRFHYPGGWRELCKKFEISARFREEGYWLKPENVESEARKLIENGLNLRYTTLRRMGLRGLFNAIRRYYPGGMPALQEKLGITDAIQNPSISPDQANEQLQKLLEAPNEHTN